MLDILFRLKEELMESLTDILFWAILLAIPTSVVLLALAGEAA